MDISCLLNQLVRHEGLCLKPYRCTAGKLTIGIGRNLDDNGITEEEARLLAVRMGGLQVELDTIPIFTRLDAARQLVLANMAYNLGVPRLKGFRKMWRALEQGDYKLAAAEMLDSRWARQVGKRATELAEQRRAGTLPEAC